jgi:two-component system chemotaxis response regulator CheY
VSGIGIEELVVLVVEPSPMQRRIIRNALLNNGVPTVLESTSAGAALDTLESEAPDLVVSSLYLPDMTGADLVQRMRESQGHSDTPFLLISSETRVPYLEPVRQAGVVGILPKPFSDTQLHTALTATLDLLSEAPEHGGELEDQALRVLVVDDSRFSSRHITRVLASLGITQIDHAQDGVQALELIARRLYDFVITDYNMPRMDGRELIEHIRQDSTQSSLPILMVTSEANENRLAAVQQIGVSAICDKPFEPAMVRQLVRRMVAD